MRTKKIIHTFFFIASVLTIGVTLGCAPPPEDKLKFEPAGNEIDIKSADKHIDKLARKNHLALLEMCLKHCQKNYHNYICTFTKQEVLRGNLGLMQKTRVKFLDKPFSVYMKWVTNPPTFASAILYVAGRYDNKMLVKTRGVLANIFAGKSTLRKPDGPDAMKDTLRPVTMFGVENSLKELIKVYEQGRKAGDIEENFAGYRELDGRQVVVLERVLPNEKPDYPAKTTFIYIDLEYLVPVRIDGYGWDDELSAFYAYGDFKFDAGLTEKDFTPKACGIEPPKK